jgi:hypothetical protein
VRFTLYAHNACFMRINALDCPPMKRRKNLSLSPKAIALGEQIAAETGKSLSAVIEEQLLAIPSPDHQGGDYWPKPALEPVERPGNPRTRYLKRKHR